MLFIKSFRKRFFIFLAVCFTVMCLSYVRVLYLIPAKIILIEGEEYVYDFKGPFFMNIKADREGLITVNNSEIKPRGNNVRPLQPMAIKTKGNGSVNLNLSVFGIIPLRTMHVDVVPNKELIACGNTIGVKLKTDGVLVIGMSDVDTLDGKRVNPVKGTGIRPGDVLTEANNTQLNSISDLVNEIDKTKGGKIRLTYRRDDAYETVVVTPVKAIDDKKHHIGLWVRDSTAGIGTLTFFDPQTRQFGALGHAITDVDTGAVMPLKSGEILESNILTIRKGRQGSPGELKGVFLEDRNIIGSIRENGQNGIYGILHDGAESRLSGKSYPIGTRNQIVEGPAKILANINGKEVEEFKIEIQKVSRQRINGSKAMVIKITDPRLIQETGGIVQGMSGSPIIQNNRIIGAVTHVLINDPTRGYGIFIESMLKNISQNMQQKAG